MKNELHAILSNNSLLDSLLCASGMAAVANAQNELLWVCSEFSGSQNGNNNLHSFFQLAPVKDLTSVYTSETFNKTFILDKLHIDGVLSGYYLKIKLDEPENDIQGFAHDLNNIFTSMLNGLDVLKNNDECSGKQKKLIDNLEYNTQKAAEITDSLLENNYSGSRRNRTKPQLLIEDVLKTISSKLEGKITVNIINETNSLIQVNRNNIYRAFLNIVTNASEAITNYPGYIQIRIKHNELTGCVEFTFTDNGSGISSENISQIFQKGYSTKSKKYDSGIGLNLTKKFIEADNGTVKVKSIEGEGTEFLVSFPEYIKPDTLEDTKTVLIADDEHIVRDLLAELLEDHNIEVIQADNGHDVLAALEMGSHVDLLILDKKMPGLDGLECAKIIRKTNKNIPIVLASGSMIEEEITLADYGITRFLKKPYNFDEIHSVIKELIC